MVNGLSQDRVDGDSDAALFMKYDISQMSIKAATHHYGDKIVQEAKLKELTNIFCLHQAGEPISPKQWLNERPLGFHMQAEVKPDPMQQNGEIVKVRAVAGGDQQILESSIQTSSPTVDVNNFKLQLGIAAFKRWRTATADVRGAFLHAFLPTDEPPIYIKIKTTDVPELLIARPDWKSYVRADGSMIIQLHKALYGLKNAPILWYNNVTKVITDAGWIKSKHDPCLFMRKDDDGHTVGLISLHVDDLFITTEQECMFTQLKQALENKYGNIKSNLGDDLAFMSMRIHNDRLNGIISIDQEEYLVKVMEKFNITQEAVTPSTEDLFVDDDKAPPCDMKLYQSLLYTILFPARFTRSDVLLDIVYLSTKATTPTTSHMSKLYRISHYLNRTKSVKLRLQPTTM